MNKKTEDKLTKILSEQLIDLMGSVEGGKAITNYLWAKKYCEQPFRFKDMGYYPYLFENYKFDYPNRILVTSISKEAEEALTIVAP